MTPPLDFAIFMGELRRGGVLASTWVVKLREQVGAHVDLVKNVQLFIWRIFRFCCLVKQMLKSLFDGDDGGSITNAISI